MLQRIFAAAGIKGVAIRQKRNATLCLTQICHCLCIVRTQKCQISKLAEVHFYRDKLAVHINVFDACRETDLF